MENMIYLINNSILYSEGIVVYCHSIKVIPKECPTSSVIGMINEYVVIYTIQLSIILIYTSNCIRTPITISYLEVEKINHFINNSIVLIYIQEER